MQRIAFFGGSFDPPHRGHLAVAAAAADQFALDRVLFAPVGHQPFKLDQPATPFLHRFAMTALAVQADPRFIPSLLNASGERNEEPDYTADSLDRLRRSVSNSAQLFTLLGADSWLQIARWHDSIRLLTLTDWIVAARPGFSLAQAERALPLAVSAESVQHSSGNSLRLHHGNAAETHVYFLPDLHEQNSATAFRENSISPHLNADAIPVAVEEYIRKCGLYSRSTVADIGTRSDASCSGELP